jgi:hypothetical protein
MVLEEKEAHGVVCPMSETDRDKDRARDSATRNEYGAVLEGRVVSVEVTQKFRMVESRGGYWVLQWKGC